MGSGEVHLHDKEYIKAIAKHGGSLEELYDIAKGVRDFPQGIYDRKTWYQKKINAAANYKFLKDLVGESTEQFGFEVIES